MSCHGVGSLGFAQGRRVTDALRFVSKCLKSLIQTPGQDHAPPYVKHLRSPAFGSQLLKVGGEAAQPLHRARSLHRVNV
jgi:hypothetical protein